MENNMKILGIVIAAAVSVIVLGSVMMPVFNEISENERTFTNTGYYRMTEINDPAYIWELNWNSAAPYVFTVNNTAMDLTGVISTSGKSIMISDNYFIRVVKSGENVSIGVYDSAFRAGVNSGSFEGTLNIVISDNMIIWTSTPTSTGIADVRSYSSTGVINALHPSGNKIMKDAAETAYLLESSTIIYGGGVSMLATGVYSSIFMHGVVSNFTKNNIDIPVSEGNVDISNVSANYVAVSGYDDLVSFTSITFTTSYNDETINQTYNYLVVPFQVTAHVEGALTDNQESLLRAIPVMVIIGILMMVVGVIRSKEI